MIPSIFIHSDYLTKALDASWLRNEVITNNISNADTPGFKSSHVEFESVLKEAMEGSGNYMKRTNSRHFNTSSDSSAEFQPEIVQDDDTTLRMDGNNVDIETQQLNMVKNAIYYNSLIQKIGEEFGRLRTAINEGK